MLRIWLCSCTAQDEKKNTLADKPETEFMRACAHIFAAGRTPAFTSAGSSTVLTIACWAYRQSSWGAYASRRRSAMPRRPSRTGAKTDPDVDTQRLFDALASTGGGLGGFRRFMLQTYNRFIAVSMDKSRALQLA